MGTPIPVEGCTSGSACNYNPAANINDGSCIFVGDPCDDGDPLTIHDVLLDCNTCMGEVDEESCPADFDGDGLVAVNDVLFLLGNFGCLSGCVADINGDDAVTAADMLAILAVFGTPCVN